MSPNASAAVTAVIVLAGIGVGYIISLWLHPERNCPRCKGQGKHWGGVWTRARRQCPRCGGTGRQPRWGTWLWERAGYKSSRYRKR